MQVIGHILKSAFQAFFRILFTAIICGALAAGAGLLVVYEGLHQWPPHQFTTIAVIVVAALAAYAGGLTVLLVAAVKALISTAKTAEKEMFSAGNLIEEGVKIAERRHEHNA